ncbi:MAG TPA: DUF308 domain-containing protein [Ktedonobacteraceae bacterium]|nr:DUF308 domain-containing protein [Ktedonobacteraceae bacterium]
MSMIQPLRANAQPFPWWIVLLDGIAALIVGICLLISPGMTTLVLVQFLGFYWLISGTLSIVGIFVNRSLWGWKLCVGILGILAGLVVIRHPLWSALFLPLSLVITLGILGLAQGIAKFAQAFQGGGIGAVLLGIIDIIFGIILLTSPLMGALAFILVLGILAVLEGIAAILAAFRLRSMPAPSMEPVPHL